MWIPSQTAIVGNELVDAGTTGGIRRLHFRKTIVSERFPEFCQTDAYESMAGKMGLCRYW
jgi:hypothetical protein